MPAAFPEQYLDLFQKKAFAAFTTLMPDGGPQTTPVWVDYQNGEISVTRRSAGARTEAACAAIRAWRSPSWTRTIPIAMSRCAARW